jgi:hypothetical protein
MSTTSPTRPSTLALETYVVRSYNYMNNMVDANGLPYFNIFWTKPAEAAHDWPDFGDVMSRQLQGAIMARHMTGVPVDIERTWMSKCKSYLDAESGLLHRPKTNYSEPVADMGDQALTLYTLVTAWLDDHDPELASRINTMVDSLLRKVTTGEGSGQGFLSGFIIKSLMVCARHMGSIPALELAEILIDRVFNVEPLFTPDNTFRHGGHMHGNLRTLVGAADYAVFTRNPVLYSRVDALYRYVRSTATRFGFLPEAIGRSGDIVSCETCALMDYIGLGVTLANHGHPEYWDDVERTVRNQLIESQLIDGSWLTNAPDQVDSEQFSHHDIGQRMLGGYAGWTSPTHFLAACETLGTHWGGPELKNKTRVFQNCCGGSGTHAFFIAWKNASRFQNGRLTVQLHLDKLIPEAEIRCYQPYQGLLTISLKAQADVRVRIPGFVRGDQICVKANGAAIPAREWGNYLELGLHPAGAMVELTYPLTETTEMATIGNPGRRQYHYRVTWKGDTVIEMMPLNNDAVTGYSDFDKREVPIFYGEEGPGRLYQRASFRDDARATHAPIHLDDGELDLWYFGDK